MFYLLVDDDIFINDVFYIANSFDNEPVLLKNIATNLICFSSKIQIQKLSSSIFRSNYLFYFFEIYDHILYFSFQYSVCFRLSHSQMRDVPLKIQPEMVLAIPTASAKIRVVPVAVTVQQGKLH